MDVTAEQRRTNLRVAQTVRLRRAEVRREIANLRAPEGRRAAIGVLMDPEPLCAGMGIYRLLTACRGIAQPTATSILARVPVSQNRGLGDLTDRQRRRIAELLEEV